MPIVIYGAIPPITPGTFFTICLEAPPSAVGTVHFIGEPAANVPGDLSFPKGDNCTKMMMPECTKLVAQCLGHPDVVLR